MSKRIVDIGDLYDGANDLAALEELGDFGDLSDEELAEVAGSGDSSREDLARAFQSGARGGFMVGALVGGLLGVGVGAAGGAFLASRYTVKAR